MGQFISSRRNYSCQDELTNGLVKKEHIVSEDVERAYRCVDRGFYVPDDEITIAYRDTAYQSDYIHLSSPGIYALVLENLRLQPGHKFLNIGSGIGYLNTVAGLLLGAYGVNHGIEINQPVIDLALQKLNKFMLKAAAIDHYNFCEPVFVQGNACQLMTPGYYDRVYCGANVPPMESLFMKSLIKINGVLVMPMDGYLLKITRKDEHKWEVDRILEVSFSDLVVPPKNSYKGVNFPPVNVLSLHDMCRLSIRSLLRENLKKQFPDLAIRTKCCLKIEEYNDNNSDRRSIESCPFHHRRRDGVNRFRYAQIIAEQSFAPLEDAMNFSDDSESDFYVDNDSEIDEEEDNNENKTEVNRLEQNIPCPTLTEPSDELTKRKSPGVGGVDQNKTAAEVDNAKRIKLYSSERTDGSMPSTSSDSWETMSISSIASYQDSDSEILDSSVDNDEVDEEIIADNYHLEQGLQLIFGEPVDLHVVDVETQISSEDARDLITYGFMSYSNVNELSIRMKKEIDSLPIPAPIRNYLNYFRYN